MSDTEKNVPTATAYSSDLQELSDLVGNYEFVYIRQKVQMLEALTMGCIEQRNIYKVLSPDGDVLLTCREQSKFINRCCCNPNHSLTIDMSRGEAPEGSDILYTAERPGLCSAKPCLCCCACTDNCTDAMILHKGHAQGNAGELIAPKPVMMVRQEMAFESPFAPAIEIMGADSNEKTGFLPAKHKIVGPMCFGGLVELCCESEWKIKGKGKGDADGDGMIVKMTPEDLKDFAREALTDADHFKLIFGPSMEADDKAALITATLLVDYMFFEKDLGICKPVRGADGWSCETTLFNCYCCGTTCGCSCSSGNNNSSSD